MRIGIERRAALCFQVIRYAANDPIVKATLTLQRCYRSKKANELLRGRSLGEAIETNIKKR